MKRLSNLTVILAVFLWISTPLVGLAQDQCATQLGPSASPEAVAQFEQWLAQKMKEAPAARLEAEVVTLPVVVHVIHRGEAVGTGSNISVAQIQSQIEVLNEDFRLLNASLADTDARFINLASDVEIEFVMAKRDPEGLPTDGIVRVEGFQSSWAFEDNIELKALSYWPAEDYVNIWVTPLAGSLLGYAQFPDSDLPGLNFGSGNGVTDGVVISSSYFGREGNIANGVQGRTTTHEIGHYLGLRHIWGDGDCSVDDFVDDTPLQEAANRGCTATNSCGSPDMINNYMNYTSDACMSLFTHQQKERIRTVLSFSPRRASLVESKGGIAPVSASSDLGIRQVLNPGTFSCDEVITPQIEVRNYGFDLITEYEVALALNGIAIDTLSTTQSLTSLQRDTLTFSPISLATIGSQELTFTVISVNGGTDGNSDNDTTVHTVVRLTQASLPAEETFEIAGSGFTEYNPDGGMGWQQEQITLDGEPNVVGVIYLPYYQLGVGEEDWILSPVVDLSDATESEFSFRYAHATLPEDIGDILSVRVSTDCGNTFPYVLWSRQGDSLTTVGNRITLYVPKSRLEFRPVSVDLSDFLGQPSVQIALVVKNGWGNNLYVDDLLWTGTTKYENDLAITALEDVPYSMEAGDVVARVQISNLGNQEVVNPTVNFQWSNGTAQSQSASETLSPGGSTWVSIPAQSLSAEGQFTLTVDLPADDYDGNNQAEISTYVSTATEEVPLRKEDGALGEWPTYVRSGESLGWDLTSVSLTEGTTEMVYRYPAYSDNAIGGKSVITSQSLDLSSLTEAGLFFDTHYLDPVYYHDTLTVWVSEDGGATWPYQAWVGTGGDLGPAGPNLASVPTSEIGWQRNYVDLSAYTGHSDVRVAWEFTNGNGQNLYMRRLEIYEDNNPNPYPVSTGSFAVWPNPSVNGEGYVTLNLATLEPTLVRVFSMQGQELFQASLERGLNQTVALPIGQYQPGMYLIAVETPTQQITQPLVVGN